MSSTMLLSAYASSTPNFRISVNPLTITVISPQAGEEWSLGETKTIQWSTTDTESMPVKVELQRTTGGGWTTLGTGLPGTGSMQIEVTEPATTQARVRVSFEDHLEYFGLSGVFSIQEPSTNTTTVGSGYSLFPTLPVTTTPVVPVPTSPVTATPPVTVPSALISYVDRLVNTPNTTVGLPSGPQVLTPSISPLRQIINDISHRVAHAFTRVYDSIVGLRYTIANAFTRAHEAVLDLLVNKVFAQIAQAYSKH